MGVNTGEQPPRQASPKKTGFWGKKGPEHLALRLEFGGRVIYEVSELSHAETITIGRSSG